jgi:hypothetical protein
MASPPLVLAAVAVSMCKRIARLANRVADRHQSATMRRSEGR